MGFSLWGRLSKHETIRPLQPIFRCILWPLGVICCYKDNMNKLLRALGVIAFLALLCVVASVAYSTWHGYIRWYFRVDGQVVVDVVDHVQLALRGVDRHQHVVL